MTTTKGVSLVDRLEESKHEEHNELARKLEKALSRYSVDKSGNKVEVIDGIRVLGVPIGNKTFCNKFTLKALKRAELDSEQILDGLEDVQTMLQIYKTCTAHKITHLFASDVITHTKADLSNLPAHWHLWDSDVATAFLSMNDTFLKSLTRSEEMPLFSSYLSGVPTTQGGLGIQHPIHCAIPTFILTTKRCVQYASSGIWVGQNRDTYQLPTTFTQLYDDWDTSTAKTFRIFQKYWHDIADCCVSSEVQDKYSFFINHSSMNTCRERIKSSVSKRIIKDLESLADEGTKGMLEDVLDRKMSMAMIDMSRIPLRNRLKNDLFTILLKRKLRLDLWPSSDETPFVCPLCKQTVDRKGDHCFTCVHNKKTTIHNTWRDGIAKIFERLCVLVRLSTHADSIDTETTGLIESMKSIRPFDISIAVDQFLDEGAWRLPLKMLGFDVTMVKSICTAKSASRAARSKTISAHLMDGEKDKFERARGGKTDDGSQSHLTGDQIIGRLIQEKMVLIPIAISPYGQFGTIFNRFLYGCKKVVHAEYDNPEKPNAKPMAELSTSRKVPRGVLKRANRIWYREHRNEYYGSSYTAADPWTYVDQQLGLLACIANGKHILKYINSVRKKSHKSKRTVGDNPITHSHVPRTGTTVLVNNTHLTPALVQGPSVDPFDPANLALDLPTFTENGQACDVGFST